MNNARWLFQDIKITQLKVSVTVCDAALSTELQKNSSWAPPFALYGLDFVFFCVCVFVQAPPLVSSHNVPVLKAGVSEIQYCLQERMGTWVCLLNCV